MKTKHDEAIERQRAIQEALSHRQEVTVAEKLQHSVIVIGTSGNERVEVWFLKDEETARQLGGSLPADYRSSLCISAMTVFSPSKVHPEWGWKLAIEFASSHLEMAEKTAEAMRGLVEPRDF